jgi:hypothetical protein
LINEVKQAIEQAYQGVIPRLENPLPVFVTHDFALRILREIYLVIITTAYKKVQKYKSGGGKIDLRTKAFLELDIEIENKVERKKQDIFKKYGLLYLEDPPSMIVHTASEKFSRESLSFARKVREIEEIYRNNVELIMKDQMSRDKFNNIIESMDS